MATIFTLLARHSLLGSHDAAGAQSSPVASLYTNMHMLKLPPEERVTRAIRFQNGRSIFVRACLVNAEFTTRPQPKKTDGHGYSSYRATASGGVIYVGRTSKPLELVIKEQNYGMCGDVYGISRTIDDKCQCREMIIFGSSWTSVFCRQQ
jgi:hypothetical protein